MRIRSKLLLILGVLLLLSSCLNWFLEKPTVTLKEVSVTRISLTDIHFLFGLEVKNPNSFDLNLRSLDYTVYFNDREVGKGRLEKEVQIGKSSSTLVQVPLQTDFKRLGDPLAYVLAGKDLMYKIEGSANLGASMGTATIPFSKTGGIRLKK